jgi:hypothetical protein
MKREVAVMAAVWTAGIRWVHGSAPGGGSNSSSGSFAGYPLYPQQQHHQQQQHQQQWYNPNLYSV